MSGWLRKIARVGRGLSGGARDFMNRAISKIRTAWHVCAPHAHALTRYYRYYDSETGRQKQQHCLRSKEIIQNEHLPGLGVLLLKMHSDTITC